MGVNGVEELPGDQRISGQTDNRLWRWLVMVSVTANITLNYLNNIRPFSGKTNGEISDEYPTLFTPAGFTFAIWGPIFLSLVLYSVYQLLPSLRKDAVYDRLSRPLVLNNALSILWVMLFSFEFLGWSALVIILMLVTALVVLVRAHENRAAEGGPYLLTVPFSLYSGWLTVATIAGIAVWLKGTEWNGAGLSASAWSMLMIVLAGIIGVYTSLRLRDFVYPLVIAWGLAGIYAGQKSTSATVATTAIVIAALVLLFALGWLIKTKGGMVTPKSSLRSTGLRS